MVYYQIDWGDTMVRMLIFGETGTGKTYNLLNLFGKVCKDGESLYVDCDYRGTEMWLDSVDVCRDRLVYISDWVEWKRLYSTITDRQWDIIILDSLSSLMEMYHDYLQNYIRVKKQYPLPTGTGVVNLDDKGIDPEMIVLPMQMYSLVYDTMLNVVTDLMKYSKNVVVVCHPIETRQLTFDGKVIHSAGRLSFKQSLQRKMDVVVAMRTFDVCDILKIRGKRMAGSVKLSELLAELFNLDGSDK